MAQIGVEQSLTDVCQALEQKGHDIVLLKSEADTNNCDCCVITGMDKNVMGMQTTSIKGPVIDASGHTAEHICQMVEQRLQTE